MTIKQKFSKGIRILLKHTLNRFTRKLARTAYGPFALVLHVGRHSGKQYETPLMLGLCGNGFVIELTYGPEVDWYKNVLAAGQCIVVWHRRRYVIDKIEPLDAEAGRAAFPRPARLILRAFRMRHFVKMTVQ
jgi:deazaflavin-dependent oxidoreductase (nitroreductase family)